MRAFTCKGARVPGAAQVATPLPSASSAARHIHGGIAVVPVAVVTAFVGPGLEVVPSVIRQQENDCGAD